MKIGKRIRDGIARTVRHEIRTSMQQIAQPLPSRPYAYMGDGLGLTQLHSGEPFFVYSKDTTITPWIILGGIWETFVDDAIHQYTKKGGTAVDVGANMGYFTVRMGRLVGPTGHVHSFEPNPELANVLRANVRLNGHNSITVVHEAAASNEIGSAFLRYTPSESGGGSLLAGATAETQIDVVTKTIDSLNLQKIDLLKVDTEGWEPEVFLGARETLSRSPECAIIFECNPPAWRRQMGNVESVIAMIEGGRDVYFLPEFASPIPLLGTTFWMYLEERGIEMGYFAAIPRGASNSMGRQ